MIRRRTHGDAGQAFPIYIMVVAGLLFLAFAYLAVGQAAANRNGAQTAADAAALAAAQETRNQMAGDWLEVVDDPTKWQDILDGDGAVFDACWRAYELADQNDATVNGCEESELFGYTVSVETNKSVGDSIVPGTEDFKSTASATAVIEPLCGFDLPDEDTDEGDGNDTLPLPQLTCDDGTWDPDPDDPASLPNPEDLFDVHLAD
ncbi:pilus assembly protein TadG-related protein [Streptomyces sp. KS_5]|uniref:pilus assembly protein TadG-related protein n=1 Tax=Streptomyces sp. KS_5 TaxID=1881018 RepID=UPI000B85780F|nr:pilus assembly protein TadG-related protein [Streptomyces sp. KS_5]